ncbi:glycosyl hydrolase 53 family protein [Rosettibacter firmus]|uniref:glycosyl hydrolase 53 family protein n=1 Tax=Rosettibacter firmus TaxID=3111522 RepID=UPI00336C0ED2
MKLLGKIFLILTLFCLNLYSQTDDFIRGVDISFTPQIEDLGGKYKLNGVVKDLLDILKEKGVNYIRLRIWHTPKDGYCGLEKTIQFAKRIKEKGFKFLLDFHYSDSWADPEKQTKPAAWSNLSFESLKDSVYSYTKFVLESLRANNVLPEMVQIGNEVTNGMLWPDGKIYDPTLNQSIQWVKFAQLLQAGINAVKDVDSSNIKIMIHIDRGGDNNGAVYFFNKLKEQKINFDVIGLSFYPWWHGTLEQLKYNLNDLSTRYNKDIIVVETAYPWTLNYQIDNHGNIVGQNTKLLQGFPASLKGQKDFLIILKKIIKETKNNKGKGFFYWEPAYISVPPIGSSWENLTLFGFTNSNLEAEALSSIDVFLPDVDYATINVKMRINTSTLNDTLKPNGIVQLRGEVKGKSSSLLPSGERITWDNLSELIFKNIDGDNWEYTFQMYEGDTLEYSIWTGHTKTKYTYLSGGWEGPVIPFDNSNKNYRLFIAGKNDTILPVQYYNSSKSKIYQYFSPFKQNNDSIGIMFRVNLAHLMSKGIFDPAKNGPVVVRGDSIESEGILSWNRNKLILKREEPSVANNSFWSGIVYFPKYLIQKGRKIHYKFYIDNAPFNGWENSIPDRYFYFPSEDSTLAWKFFNDKNLITDIKEDKSLPDDIKLYQNYPNPFNSSTTIKYELNKDSYVSLCIYNSLGELVKVLDNKFIKAGSYSILWDGRDDNGIYVPSGIYFLNLVANEKRLVNKLILLK